MPVERFRSIADWNAASVNSRKSGGFDRFLRHNATIRMLARFSFPSGVYRYRSLADAQRDRESWAKLRARESR